MKLLKNLIGFFRYRFKLYYSIIRCRLGAGSFAYSLSDAVKFVCHKEDSFSKIIYISGGHEKLEMKWCSRFLSLLKKKCMVLDCGANIGYFSSYLAQTNSTCGFLAIEGNQNTFKFLQKTIKKLNLPTISARLSILRGDKDLHYEIPDDPGREPWQQAKQTDHSVIETVTLDGLVENKDIPSLVKIDCEGFEVKILRGAENLLQRGEAVFMVECNDAALNRAEAIREELFEIFRKNKYKLFHLSSFDKNIPPGAELDTDFPSKEFNFAAIPDKADFMKHWKILSESLKPLYT